MSQKAVWQPINTAKEEGIRVLLWSAEWEEPACGVFQMDYRAGRKLWTFSDGDSNVESQPTHWLPLPPYPDEQP